MKKVPKKARASLELKGRGYKNCGGYGLPSSEMKFRKRGTADIKAGEHLSHTLKSEGHQKVGQRDGVDVQQQYAKSLEQQIQLLELENSYLRRSLAASGDKQPSGTDVILSRGNEVSINGRDWCRLPSFHPDIAKVIEHRSHSYQDCPICRSGCSTKMTKDIPRYGSCDIEKVEVRERAPQKISKRFQEDAQLLQNLKEREQQIRALEQSLEEKMRTIETLQERIQCLTQKLGKIETERHSKQEIELKSKRALMEEILELQRRLDDLTPALAAKEARIIQLANERDDLGSKMRALNETVAELQLDLREKGHVDDLYSEKIKSANEDIERAKDELLQLKNESFRRQQKEDELLENVFTLRNQLREAQLKSATEKALQEKISAENTKLIEENTRLLSEIARITISKEREQEERERDIEAQAHEEIVELRLHVKAHKTQIGILEERLQAAVQRCDQLRKELEMHNSTESAAREERLRIQNELDALQALSKSLASENKSLREDKVLLTEKIETLENLMVSRENVIAEMQDVLIAKENDRREAIHRATDELRKQQQRSLGLEELSRRVKELSESIGCHDSSPSKSSSADSRREHVPSSTETLGSFHRRLSSIPELIQSPEVMQHIDQAHLPCQKCPALGDVIEITQGPTKTSAKRQL